MTDSSNSSHTVPARIYRLHYVQIVKGFLWLFSMIAGALYMPSFIWNSMVFSSDLSQEFFIHLSKRILIHHEYFEVGYLSLSVWMVCWLIILSGPMILMVYLLRYAYTQVEIQDLILTYKTGLFFTSIREVDIRDIEELFVNSGVFGTALGYGYVTFFVEGDKFTIPNLNKPQAFINRINYIKSSHRS